MRRRTLAAFCLTLALVPAAAAQSSAPEVVDQMRAAFTDMMDGVDDYIVETDAYTMYFQRDPDGGEMEFKSAMRLKGDPNAMLEPMELGVQMGEEQFNRMAANTVYKGMTDVDGRRVHSLYAPDISLLSPQVARQMEGQSGEGYVYVDAETWMPVGMEMEMDVNGSRQTMNVRMKDYREIEGMLYPFLTVVEMPNIAEAMSPEDRRQLEEMEAQMKDLPEAQRKMVERMMGGQLEKLREAMNGGTYGHEIAVERVLVNAGIPDGIF